MTLRQYLTVMVFGTIFCWIALWFVLKTVDPFQGDTIGFLFFYISAFLTILGTLSIIAFLLRRFFSRIQLPIYQYVQKSFRDAFLLSSATVLLLFLQGSGYLHLWNVGIFIITFILVWLFIWTTKKDENQTFS